MLRVGRAALLVLVLVLVNQFVMAGRAENVPRGRRKGRCGCHASWRKMLREEEGRVGMGDQVKGLEGEGAVVE